MKKVLIITTLIIILVVSVIINMNVPNKKVSEAFKNIENFSKTAKPAEESNSMLEDRLNFYEGLKIDVSKKKIEITENSTNNNYTIFYNLDDSLTFYTLAEVNNQTTYNDYVRIVEENSFIMKLCYIAILSSQTKDLETNYEYISQEFMRKLSQTQDNFILFNGDANDFESYELSEEDTEKKVIFIDEFEKYAVEYFSDTYKNIIFDDNAEKNTYKTSITAENVTNDSCTIKFEIELKNNNIIF